MNLINNDGNDTSAGQSLFKYGDEDMPEYDSRMVFWPRKKNDETGGDETGEGDGECENAVEDNTCCPGCFPVFQNNQLGHIGKYGCLGPDYDADGPYFVEPIELSDEDIELAETTSYTAAYQDNPDNHVIFKTSFTDCVKQLDKGQDHAVCSAGCIDLNTGEEFSCIEVYDGHGHDACIDAIRCMDTREIIQQFDDPTTEIQRRLHMVRMRVDSGATCSIAKIYKNRVECTMIGDSRIMVFVNGSIVYESPMHNWDCMDERERLNGLAVAHPAQCPEVLSADKIAMVPSAYVYFCDGMKLAITQSLGHLGKTGFKPEKKVVHFEDEDSVVILVASDGFWDMVLLPLDLPICLNSDATELAEFAESRWKQTWNVVTGPDTTALTQFDRADDVTVAVWSRSVL